MLVSDNKQIGLFSNP